MTVKGLVALVAALGFSTTAKGQAIKEIPLVASQNPSGANVPFSQAVWAGDTLYVSGWLDPNLKDHPDVKSQTIGILQDMQKFLASQKLTMGNVVMMREYIQSDPKRDSRADILGARAAFSEFFGNSSQPRKPASTLMQAVLPSSARGALMEIDVIAVRSGTSSRR